MLYKMHSQGKVPGEYSPPSNRLSNTVLRVDAATAHPHYYRSAGVTLDPKLFQEVHSSKYGLVRVYKVGDAVERSGERPRREAVCASVWLLGGAACIVRSTIHKGRKQIALKNT